MSLNLALGPDSGDSHIDVDVRRLENHSETRHIYIVQLLMKQCLQKMKEHAAESRLTTVFSPNDWQG